MRETWVDEFVNEMSDGVASSQSAGNCGNDADDSF